jgi:glycosyltransferase involved in cell wall biosynthesis
MGRGEKISVIIPVYNVERYLPRCLESCISQTLYDVEFICVNDGSTDGSLQILKDYAALDGRIKIISKENGGLSSARNVGLDAACGEWIMFLDSDDFLTANACMRVWVESEEANTDIIAFGAELYPKNPRPDVWYERTLYIGTRRYFGFKPEILFKEPGAKPFVWRQAYRKSFLDRVGVKFDDGYGEDIIFQFKVFPHAENVSFISDRLYVYRWYRQGSLMAQVNSLPSSKLEQHLSIVDRILSYWSERGITEKYGVYTLDWVLEFIVNDLIENDYEKKKEYASALLDMIDRYGLKKYRSQLWADRASLYRRLTSI